MTWRALSAWPFKKGDQAAAIAAAGSSSANSRASAPAAGAGLGAGEVNGHGAGGVNGAGGSLSASNADADPPSFLANDWRVLAEQEEDEEEEEEDGMFLDDMHPFLLSGAGLQLMLRESGLVDLGVSKVGRCRSTPG